MNTPYFKEILDDFDNVCARRDQKPSLLGLCQAAAKCTIIMPLIAESACQFTQIPRKTKLTQLITNIQKHYGKVSIANIYL